MPRWALIHHIYLKDARAHVLPSPQGREGRKGGPNSVNQGEYLGHENWYHINKKYQFHDPKSLTSGHWCQNPTKWRQGLRLERVYVPIIPEELFLHHEREN